MQITENIRRTHPELRKVHPEILDYQINKFQDELKEFDDMNLILVALSIQDILTRRHQIRNNQNIIPGQSCC